MKSALDCATPSQRLRSPFPVGPLQLVGDKYLIEDVLGEGATGVVFCARHCQLGHRVALKVLRPELAQADVVERFRRQAGSVASIPSEHVCRVLDVIALQNGLPCVVMEHLEGQDLARDQQQRKRYPFAEALAYTLQACLGLAHALASGAVHRDLKPSKLVLARRVDGSTSLKIVGLGTDAGRVQEALQLTAARRISGRNALAYLAPEQLEAPARVDARSNVWVMAAIFYELLRGEPLICANVDACRARLRELEPGLPQGLLAVLERALEPQPEQRYASVAELASALEPFARPAADGGKTRPTTRRRPRHLTGWLAAGVCIGLTAGVISALYVRGREPPRTVVQPIVVHRVVSTEHVAAAEAPASPEPVIEPEPVTEPIPSVVLPAPAPVVPPPLKIAPVKPPGREQISDFGGRR